jgi:acid phosphatase type 7
MNNQSNLLKPMLAIAFALTTLSGLGQATLPSPETTAPPERPIISGRVAEWFFWPDYALPGPDRQIARPMPSVAQQGVHNLGTLPPERLLLNHRPTERWRDLLPADKLPDGPFTVEYWISYHVDQPVGANLMVYNQETAARPSWCFGFYQGELYLRHHGTTEVIPAMEIKSGKINYLYDQSNYRRGLDRYWHHLVAVFDQNATRVFHNGEQRESLEVKARDFTAPENAVLELAAYLENEPHMELANLVKYAAIYDRPLDHEEIDAAFEDHRELVELGIHFRDHFHFTTGAPHVAMPGKDHVYLVWETDRPAAATVHWGETSEMQNRLDLPNDGKRNRKVKIEGLRPNQEYHYQVTLETERQHRLDSGALMFRTAVEPGDPITFAAISDTEARPHVNAHLADLIWSETPHLVVNVGDLTDGGRHDQRVEWTHEYFAAMGHLMARTPFLPVMGNGEDDFVWFDRYHQTSAPEISYYNYVYGDVEFFVLDSNLGKRDAEQPEFRKRQRTWFETALKASKARWKIVAHHHPVLFDRYPMIVSDFVDLYEKFGVEIVLVGHHHNYRRSWPLHQDQPVENHGVVYIQLGGGGGNRSYRPKNPDLRWAKTYQGYGYSMFWIHGDQLAYAMYDDRGGMRDYFSITK